MKISEQYVNGLKKAYLDNNAGEIWAHFESVKHGTTNENSGKVKKAYPAVPDSLIELLAYADGTYHREYQGEKIAFYFFGSDVEEYGYPYYLLSAEQILIETEFALEHEYGLYDFLDWVNEYGYFELYDERLTDDPEKAKWLCFSHCMNNGGTSVLYIDFSPSEKGKAGQVVRYLHDPDQYKVIADSFDEYLKMLMDHGYRFINVLLMDD